MKLPFALSLMALNLVRATPVPEACLTRLSARDDVETTTPPDLCEGAVNCQTVLHNRTGTYGVDFKPNMGPGSNWFAQNVEPYDPYSDNYNANAPSDADTEDDKKKNKITSDLDRSKAKIMWGDARPDSTLRDGLDKHCFQSSCDADWTVGVSYSQGDVTDGAPPRGELKFNAIGTYPGKKDNYAHAIAAIAKKLMNGYDQGYDDCVPVSGGSPTCTGETIHEFKCGRYFSITRFLHTNGRKAINGYVHVKVEFIKFQNGDVCSDIIDGLTAIMGAGGAVAGIGSGFFGILGNALCQG